jgi:hypothetical protein
MIENSKRNRLAIVQFVLLGLAAVSHAAETDPISLDAKLHHLRAEGPREWSEFPEQAEAAQLDVRFAAEKNDAEWTLELRQQEVKQDWNVLLNDKPLGKLVRDENDMRIYLPVSAGTVVTGENTLRVAQGGRNPAVDDIRVGEFKLHRRELQDVLFDATIDVNVYDADSKERIPCRLTIVDEQGALQTVWPVGSHEHLAIRPGVVYTATGNAALGLPPGKYKFYAGRGFEYSLDAAEFIALGSVETVGLKLSLRREVPTDGYVACDTHVHTLTHSGHGDATALERMITIAGEGIELPVAADHNVQIDHRPYAEKLNVRQYFTPVVGNEVTTRTGHFNIFPVKPGGPVPDARLTEWKAIFDEIERTTGAKAIILNHARDLHGGTRPFGPALHNALVGENLEGWHWGANAMEVINSGATQTDATQLLHDWMGMLNRGRIITPVGSSDSHDVARHFVGQGRTYIRADDRDAAKIDVDEAVSSFVAGRVLVSYGLLAEIDVNDRFASGEIAPAADEYRVGIRVLGPHWTTASRVELYANGQLLKQWEVPPVGWDSVPTIPERSGRSPDLPRGVKWQGEHVLAKPPHDVFLTVIATGPGIDGPYWKTAKAYQPTSPDWTPHVLACSGAVWLDADGDGKRTAAYDYARRAFDASGGDLPKLIDSIAGYDRAVSAQAAHLVQSSGTSLLSDDAQAAWTKATPDVQAGFRAYLDAWRENQAQRAR